MNNELHDKYKLNEFKGSADTYLAIYGSEFEKEISKLMNNK